MGKLFIAAIGTVALGCIVAASAQAGPLASSNGGRWNAKLTPVAKSTRRIVLGKSDKGRQLRVLVRKTPGESFSLVLEDPATRNQRRPSLAKGFILDPNQALQIAQKTMIKNYVAPNLHAGFNAMEIGTKCYGKVISKRVIQLGTGNRGTLYDSIYHGINAEGTAHIVEFRPFGKNKDTNSTFMNIDLKGNATFSFTVPNGGRGKGHVWGAWENHALKR